MDNPLIRIFSGQQELAESAAALLADELLNRKHNGRHRLALSGGSTPRSLFNELARLYGSASFWSWTELYWGDERCVPPDHPDSNYLMTAENLLNKLSCQPASIHRIQGEIVAERAALRYEKLLKKHCPLENQYPVIDTVLLGIGTDGHTASLFPGVTTVPSPDNVTAVSRHPESGQNRVTLTAETISAAEKLIFLVSGTGKKNQIEAILTGRDRSVPAARISGSGKEVEWWIDRAAAGESPELFIGRLKFQ